MESQETNHDSLPLACEALTHVGDGVGGEGKGHDPCSIDGAWEDGWAGLIGRATGFEDGGHGGGHGWHGDGRCCSVCCHCWVGDEQVIT